MIEKKDWVQAEKTFKELTTNSENQIINAQINIELYKILLPFIQSKIKEFPDDKIDDPMPEELKEILPSK